MTDKTLSQHVQKIGSLKAEIDALNELYEYEKGLIIDALNERKIDNFKARNYSVDYITLTRKQVDTAKLKASNLYEQYIKECISTRFTVKAR